MKLLSKSISIYDECSPTMRKLVLAAVPVRTVGQVILYLEVRLLPWSHLVNCIVTVQTGEESPPDGGSMQLPPP